MTDSVLSCLVYLALAAASTTGTKTVKLLHFFPDADQVAVGGSNNVVCTEADSSAVDNYLQ